MGFLILRKTPFLPRHLGGTADHAGHNFIGYPDINYDYPYLKEYCLLTLAFPLADFVELASEKNPFDTILHHISWLALFVCSFITRQYSIGAVILVLHSVSDIFLYPAKILSDTTLPGTTAMFASCMIAFAYTRLYVFPAIVIGDIIEYGDFSGFNPEYYLA